MITGYIRNKVAQRLEKSDITINGSKKWDIQVADESIYRDVVLRGTLGLGDGYMHKKWDVKDLDAFFHQVLKDYKPKKVVRSPVFHLQALRNKFMNTQIGKRAFEVGEVHYNLGNEMYEYMLGESMAYSAAMFNDPKDDLTTAQYNKFDALCKELKLEPGMKILEIGCGWGTFAKYAIDNYGVTITGLTVSKEQKAYAEKVCEGLDAQFVLQDYQKLDDSYHGAFDRVVSIEMIEAVGEKNFGTYFKTIEKVLKKDGLAGIQAIVGTGGSDPFLSTRIFPNGLVPSEKHIVDNSEGLLRIKHWVSFGTDYDKTLVEWDARFRKNWKHIKKLTDENGNKIYDEAFYRMWRFYLLLCAASFRVGINDDCQIIFSKPTTHSPLR